jgi:osmotically-inducible protein OsmY
MKSNAQIQQDVITELKWEPSVNATNIGVEVHDGIVTLSGQVPSYAEKLAAERAAQRVSGVKVMTVDIEVTLFGWGSRTDIDIARSAESALQWVTYLPKDSIKVLVEKGWITLSGQVEWDYQRQVAIGAVRHLTGVKGVSDNTTIKPSSTSAAIKENIEAALERRYDADDQDIRVEVHGSDVTLNGTVSNMWQLELARESAWNAPGVQHVASNLTVSY